MEIIGAAVLLAVGAGCFSFVIFLINRYDKKHNILESLELEIKHLEDNDKNIELALNRLELQHLIEHKPDQMAEILKLAEYYFADLKGDFYMTAIFQQYLQEHNIEIPTWFENK